jgi:hypothetical protein
MGASSRLLLGAVLAAAHCGAAAAQRDARPDGGLIAFEGMCEPSAAVDAGTAGGERRRLVVANDGDNLLRAYDAERGGAPVPVLDLDEYLRIPPAERGERRGRADIEGAARLGNRIFWIASHSRESDRGDLRPNRHRFFATTADPATSAAAGAGAAPALRPVGASRSLLRALAEERLGLRRAIGTDGRGKPRERDEDAKPEGNGLNIEGLARGRKDGTLLIGLRSPLRDGKAILLPFANPREVVDKKRARPDLGRPILLDLGGRGVRSIEYADGAPSERRYLIVAGPPGDGDDFTLYRWSGEPGDRPAEIPGAAAAFRRFAEEPDERGERFRFGPEALVVDGGSGATLRLLSDDGDRPMGGPDGRTCQAGGAPVERRSFRGTVLRLD